MENRYFRYLVDPVYDEDYGVSQSPSRLAIAGLAVGASLLFLRSPAARGLAQSMFRRRAPAGQTSIEQGITGLYHQRRELKGILASVYPDDVFQQEHLLERHTRTLRREFVQRALEERGMLAGRAMGLRPVTVRDVLERRFSSLELQPFRLMRGGISTEDIGYLGDAPAAMMEGWMRGLAKDFPDFMEAAVDPGLFKTAQGQLVDLRGMRASFDAFIDRLSDISIPVVNWNIGQIARLPLVRDIQTRPAFAYFKAGSHQPFVGGVLQEDALLLGRRLVSLSDPERVIADRVYASLFGTPVRAAAQIAQVSPGRAYRSQLHEVLDVGAQAEPSWFAQMRSIATKGKDPADVRGALRQMLAGESFESPAQVIYQAIMQDPVPLPETMMQTPAVRRAIERAYPGVFQDGVIHLQTQEELIETMYALLSRDAVSSRYRRELMDQWRHIARSPESYFRRMSFTRDRLPQLPYGGPPQVRAVPQEQRLRHLLQMEIRQYMKETLGGLPTGLRLEDAASHRALRRMAVADVLSSARNAEELRQLMLESTSAGRQFRRMLKDVVHELSPWYAPGYLGPSPSRAMAKEAGGSIVMREWVRPPTLSDLSRAVHNSRKYQEVAEQTRAFFRQFAAGRHRPQDFTTASLIPYHMMSRLNDMFTFFGVGLSQRHLGSAQQIFTNILTRRYLGTMALLGYAGYLSWEIGNLTGYSPKQAALDVAAGINVGWSRLMNITGITSLTQRMDEVMPGTELFWELPVTSFLDPRWEAEELAEFLAEGEAPVRRGRWWQFGGTPIQGGPIEHFWPSWYRRLSEDWEFTHVGWGDRDTAYAHWWLPTPRHPIAPIRHFITDPYHLEEMWGRERPYPITGPIPFFENLPVIGPLLSATVGRLLKPPVRMYEDELLAWQRGELEPDPLPEADIGPVAMATPAGLVRVQRYLAAPEQPHEPPRGIAAIAARLQAIHDNIMARDAALAEAEGELPADTMLVSGPVAAAPPDAIVETPSSGILTAAARLRGIHERTMARSRLKEIEQAEMLMEGQIPPELTPPPGVPVRIRRMRQLGREVPPSRDLPGGDSLRFQLAESYSELSDIAGLYGFLLRSVTGGAERSWEDVPRLATPRREMTLGRWFRDLQLGGFPGELSEVGRRLIPTQRHLDPEVEVNPLRNLMPSWMPGEDYFLNFQQGDPYSYLSGAMYRLPGPGFEMMQGVAPLEERLETLFPDTETRSFIRAAIEQGMISPYETYGLWERFKILADVAPYSDEYQYYANLLTQNKHLIPPAKLGQFQRIKQQASEYKRRERFFPYRFRDAELEHSTVTVRRVIDSNTFIAHGMDRPVRLAGVYAPTGQDDAGEQARDFLGQFIYPGARVTIGYAADELRRYGSDQLESIRAVVTSGGTNVNRALIVSGIGQEREADDPASVHVRFSAAERAIGGLWERFAHLDTFLHTKFLNVRSPYEMYRRREVFGKDWQAWHAPISDFLIPTLESFAAAPPYVSALYGYGYGRLVTIASQDRKFAGRVGLYGAALFAGLSLLRSGSEMMSGETWIPRRRRRQRDFELYFSALEYVKYRGLYEFAARRAWEEERFDVHEFFGDTRRRGRGVTRDRRALEALKRELIIEGTDLSRWRLRQIYRDIRRLGGDMAAQLESEIDLSGFFDKEAVHKALLRGINARINYLGEQRRYFDLPPWAEIAVMAREQYESTIYGMDLYGHLEPIMRGLPRSERRYIAELLDAPAFERQKILDIAPIYTRRVLQARWGMDVEPLPSLEEVFSRHFLPPVTSGLWSPAKSLEDLKLKTAESVGLELTELGFWPQDERRAERHEAPALPWMKPAVTGTDLERTLRAILEGQGLEEVWVRLSPSQKQGVRMQFNIKRDPSHELRDLIVSNPHMLVGGP